MLGEKVKKFLDDNKVRYTTMQHSVAYTAQEIAALAHIPGKELAKTVIVRVDGELAMAVVPASLQVDVERLKEAFAAKDVRLAEESDFSANFPDCERGAMPPFGNLYGMPVYVAEALAEDEEIAFNAGTHRDLIRMRYADFERLVQPKKAKFGARAGAGAR